MPEDESGPDPTGAVRRLDPGFLDAYQAMADVPRASGHLTPRVRALIALAVDANVTHLDPAGVCRHIREALAFGATPEEVMEVLECCATVAVHALNVGVPVLLEVLDESGGQGAEGSLDARRRRLQQEFTQSRGYWNSTWDAVLALAPDMFEAYSAFSAHPWRMGHLAAVERELVYVAFDTSATHLYEVGLKLHIENALGYGATPEQVLEVMEVASLIGMKSVTIGAPILEAEMARVGAVPQE